VTTVTGVLLQSWPDEIAHRLSPAATPPDLSLSVLGVVVLAAALAALVDPLWRVLRLGVTLVHELGHAFVGMLVGRRFTGFVLRGDMSGHAVTVGPPRGIGRLVTTWAGYPMPGVVALGLVAAASQRYAAPLLTALLVGLLITVPRVRSLLTAIVVGLTTAALGCLWWWGTAAVQAQVLIGIALILLVGGWRHLGAVASATTAGSDPAVLRQLSGIPALAWNTTFALTLGACSWGVWTLLAP
jgi:hypothetical protein